MKILNKLTTKVLRKTGTWGMLLSIAGFLISLIVMIWTAVMSWATVGTVIILFLLSAGIWVLADSDLWKSITGL